MNPKIEKWKKSFDIIVQNHEGDFVRMRDIQRQKVYDGERLYLANMEQRTFETIFEIEQYVWSIQSSSWFKQLFGTTHKAYIKSTNRTTSSGGKRWHNFARRIYINLCKAHFTEWVILHELAHGLQPRPSQGHGPEFCAIYLLLVQYVMGDKACAALIHGFHEKRVDFRPYKNETCVYKQVYGMAWDSRI